MDTSKIAVNSTQRNSRDLMKVVTGLTTGYQTPGLIMFADVD